MSTSEPAAYRLFRHPGRRFYRGALRALQEAEIPFLVGGAYAYSQYTAIARDTKDFDIFVHPRDVERALEELRALLAGERVHGFRLSRPPVPAPTVTVAAFGPRAVEIARDADRMVLNMVTVDAAKRLAARHANTAAWLCVAVDPNEEQRRWLTRGFVGYLAAPGYGEMFVDAGYGELVEFARTRPSPKELFERVPDDLLDHVARATHDA